MEALHPPKRQRTLSGYARTLDPITHGSYTVFMFDTTSGQWLPFDFSGQHVIPVSKLTLQDLCTFMHLNH